MWLSNFVSLIWYVMCYLTWIDIFDVRLRDFRPPLWKRRRTSCEPSNSDPYWNAVIIGHVLAHHYLFWKLHKISSFKNLFTLFYNVEIFWWTGFVAGVRELGTPWFRPYEYMRFRYSMIHVRAKASFDKIVLRFRLKISICALTKFMVDRMKLNYAIIAGNQIFDYCIYYPYYAIPPFSHFKHNINISLLKIILLSLSFIWYLKVFYESSSLKLFIVLDIQYCKILLSHIRSICWFDKSGIISCFVFQQTICVAIKKKIRQVISYQCTTIKDALIKH